MNYPRPRAAALASRTRERARCVVTEYRNYR